MNLGLLQLGLLIWKCWKSEGRNPIRLSALIIVPLLMFVLLAGFRIAFNLKTKQTECHFVARPMPSAGHVPFLQGLVCNFDNKCQDNKTLGEDGKYPFKSTIITRLIRDADIVSQKLAANPNDLMIDGSYFRMLGQVMVLRDIFQGKMMPPEAKRFSTLTGIWALLCDREFPLANQSSSGASNPFFSTSGASTTTTPSGPQDECTVFLQQFNQIKPLWSAVAPIFQGKIVFYPDNNLTRVVMKKVETMLDWQTNLQQGVLKLIELINKGALNYQNVMSSPIFAAMSSSLPKEAQPVISFLGSNEFFQLVNVDLPLFYRRIDCFRSVWFSSAGNTTTSALYVPPTVNPYSGFARVEGAYSIDQLISLGLQYSQQERLLAAVEFKDPEQWQGIYLPNLIRYAIRMDPSKLDTTKEFKDRAFNTKVRRDPAAGEMNYFVSGFIYLQDAIEKSIIQLKSNSIYSTIGTILQQFPFPCYMIDQFMANLANQLLMFIVLGWIYPASMICKSVCLEKERKLREVARIMGISPGLHFLSWFIFWITLLLISVILFVLLVKGANLFTYSNPGIILLLMITYAASVISFSFFISSFFSKANIGAVVGGLAYFMTYIAFGGISNGNAESLGLQQMMLASLMPNIALGFAWNTMGRWELTLEGSQGRNFRTPITDEAEDQYTLFHSWIMLLVDTILYYFIAWYIEHVFPGEYGVPRPFYFIFQPSFWCGGCCKPSPKKGTDSSQNQPPQGKGPFLFEDEPTHLPLGASLDSIVKIYDFSVFDRLKQQCSKKGSQKRMAVNNLSLNMYEGQITALLGHNGAGKTTTMSIMTGLIAATEGSVTISGHDVATELEEVRKVLGFCPQFNVLYEDLTVAEHLWFYARIRGIDNSIIKDDIEQMLKDTNLTIKRNEPARVLSGGMKRRLSIAVAFIGNSKCVILDEPTAGVDPYARRALWDLLSKFRAGRTIILSTHHMDEAEVLADRIAVMSQGKLQTCGSPLFLKESCGEGYQLTIVQQKRMSAGAKRSDGNWERRIEDYVKKSMPEAKLGDEVNEGLLFKLPYNSVSKFPQFFQALERSKTELGIQAFGVSDSTMEEIFIKMADMADAAERGEDNAAMEDDNEPSSSHATVNIPKEQVPPIPDYEPRKGIALTSAQFLALLVKRFHRTRRNIKGFVTELILPMVFVLLGVIIIKVAEFKPGNAPPIEIQPWLMQPNSRSTREQRLYMFTAQNINSTSEWSSTINTAAARSEYGGARCMDPAIYKIENYACKYSTMDSEWKGQSERYRQRFCECTTEGVQKCQDTTAVDQRNSLLLNYGNVPYRLIRTGDDVLNLTGMDISQYIVNQYQSLKSNLYGGFSYLTTPVLDLAQGGPVSSITTNFVSSAALTVWFNNKGYLSGVGYTNYANNMLYRLAMSQGNVDNAAIQHGIVAINQPLNYTKEQFTKELTRSVLIDVLLAIMLILALSFVPASFVMFLIEDRVSDSKHVQIVSGLRPAIYWLGNFMWDCINFLVPAVVCLIIFAIFNLSAYINEKSTGPLFLLFILYGFSVAPMLYTTSYFLDTPSTAFVLLACANLFIGAGTTVATWFLDLFATTDEAITPVNDILKVAFFIFPQYCLGRGLVNLATSYRRAQGTAFFLGSSDVLSNHNPMEWDVCGKMFFAMGLHLVGWFLLILFIEYRQTIFKCCYTNYSTNSVGQTPEPDKEDPDVAEERRSVMADDGGPDSPYTMLVKNLHKTFRMRGGKKMTAVRKLTFGVNNSQCFGLLGVNGAGKSTTFNMLTGRLFPSSGSATIRGYDILGNRNEANKLIGYCPQYDCITPLLSGRENLEFFARLRGVPEKFVKEVATCNIMRMDLSKHADKQSGAYSGGNKRKLSAAIALTGEPPLVFLDEPTAGIDPRARRFLWRAISDLLKNGQSVVLTTHSMDECEALCSRLGIMVNGEFKCMGSPQHLKARFGEGYLVNLRFKSSAEQGRLAQNMTKEFEAALKSLKDKFQDVNLKEAHDNVAVYSIGASGKNPVPVGDLFGFLANQSTQQSLKISEYSVMQSSLDAVFVTFAKLQQSDMSDEERRKALEEQQLEDDQRAVSDIEDRSPVNGQVARGRGATTAV